MPVNSSGVAVSITSYSPRVELSGTRYRSNAARGFAPASRIGIALSATVTRTATATAATGNHTGSWPRRTSLTTSTDSPVIMAPRRSLVASATRQTAGDGAPEQDEDPVAQAAQLVQVLGDDQHPGPRVAQLVELLVDVAVRADVQAPGRLRRDEHLRPAPEGPRQEHLLHAAAREAGHGVGRRGPDVEPPDHLLRMRPDRRLVEHAAARERGQVLEDQVVLHTQLRDHAAAPVLGEAVQAGVETPSDIERRHVGAVHLDATARGQLGATQDVHQLRLAVAADPREADDLPGPDLEGEVVESRSARTFGVTSVRLSTGRRPPYRAFSGCDRRLLRNLGHEARPRRRPPPAQCRPS